MMLSSRGFPRPAMLVEVVKFGHQCFSGQRTSVASIES